MEMPDLETLTKAPATEPDMESFVPKPCGYKVLVHIRQADEKTAGGIIKIQEQRAREQTSTMVAKVIELGPQAYADKSRFPEGAWCAPGDWIMFRAHSGTRFKVGDQEFRLINDDTIEAVVADPTQIDRV